MGVALGLAGRDAEAAAALRPLTADAASPAWWSAAVARVHELAGLIENDPRAFRSEVYDAIASFRAALKLDPSEAAAALG